MRRSAASLAKAILPAGFVAWYRRRRALRRYLRTVGDEVVKRRMRMDLDELEGRIAARRDGFYERLVREVLERTDLILQELDRRIEGVNARHGSELRSLHDRLASLEAELASLRRDHEDRPGREQVEGTNRGAAEPAAARTAVD